MIVALWIIAVCEVIRIVQNAIQLMAAHAQKDMYKMACDEFVKSLHQSDADFYKGLIKIVGKTDIKEDPEECKQ